MRPGYKTLKSILIMLLGSLLLGCETVPHQDSNTNDRVSDAISNDTGSQYKVQPPPPQVSAALMPPMKIEVPIPEDVAEDNESHFDVAAKNVSAKEFFMSLVDGTPTNLVVDPEVTGEITLNLKNVTIRETMNIVRDVYGYQYQKTKLGYMVFARKIQSRIYSVNYLNIKRSGVSEMRIGSGHLLTESSNSQESADPSDNRDLNDDISGSVIKTSSEVDFWADLGNAFKTIVGHGSGRSVIVNPQSGLVLVKAMPAELKNIDEFIHQLQNTTERQVILEAKILEVNLNTSFPYGIDWTALGDPKYWGNDASNIQHISSNNSRGLNDVTNPNTLASGSMFSHTLNLHEFDDFIELLKRQGSVRVLSSPRVSTVNNQKTTIKIGSDEYFVTEVNTNVAVSRAGTESVNPNIKLKSFFSGIALDLTPQITDDGSIMLHVHPMVSEVVDKTKAFTVGDKHYSLPLALSNTRESDSIIRAHDGQIVVVSGLMKNQTGEPAKSELVVLLRPIVIDNVKQPSQVRGEATDRSSDLDQNYDNSSKIELFGTMNKVSSN